MTPTFHRTSPPPLHPLLLLPKINKSAAPPKLTRVNIYISVDSGKATARSFSKKEESKHKSLITHTHAQIRSGAFKLSRVRFSHRFDSSASPPPPPRLYPVLLSLLYFSFLFYDLACFASGSQPHTPRARYIFLFSLPPPYLSLTLFTFWRFFHLSLSHTPTQQQILDQNAAFSFSPRLIASFSHPSPHTVRFRLNFSPSLIRVRPLPSFCTHCTTSDPRKGNDRLI